MIKIDHLIDKFAPYIDWATRDFMKEWITGNYKKYSDWPSYKELKVLLDSVNILRKYYGWESVTVTEIVEDYN